MGCASKKEWLSVHLNKKSGRNPQGTTQDPSEASSV